MLGKIVMVNQQKRYGFINGDDGNKYFFGFADVKIPGMLDKGYNVEFTTTISRQGRQAVRIRPM